jgi:peptidyl-prolyl cis-trans isomerase SurA
MSILFGNRLKFFPILLGLFCLISKTSIAGKIADRIVAVVGNEVILQSELESAVNFVKLTGQNLPPDSLLYEIVLDELIKNQLLIVAAQKETIEVSRSEIEAELQQSLALLRQRFTTQAEFDSALKSEGLTERELKERYRAEIKKRLITQKLLAKKEILNIPVTAREVYNFYETYKDSIAKIGGVVKLAHILFMIKPQAPKESLAQKKVMEIYDIVLRGGDFEEVARSFSEDFKTARQGGYIGKISLKDLSPEFVPIVESLKVNEISAPFRTPAGYEIIKCLSKKRDTVELAHIFIPVKITKEDSLATKKLCERVRKELQKGKNFEELAKIYSDDIFTKDSGGYLGEFQIDNLNPPFRDPIKNLAEGEISQPILSEHGYHLIKVIEKEEERILSFKEIEDDIREYLRELKIKEKLEEYLERLARTTYIQKYL